MMRFYTQPFPPSFSLSQSVLHSAPEIVGITANNNLVLGKHSGRNAFRTRVEYLLKQSDSSHPPHVLAKLTSDKKAFESLFEQFKKLADTKKRIGDVDLMALVDEHFGVARAGLIETYVLQVRFDGSGVKEI